MLGGGVFFLFVGCLFFCEVEFDGLQFYQWLYFVCELFWEVQWGVQCGDVDVWYVW